MSARSIADAAPRRPARRTEGAYFPTWQLWPADRPLLEAADDTAWQRDAACVGRHVELDAGDTSLCGDCPVRCACRGYGAAHGLSGVWGGAMRARP